MIVSSALIVLIVILLLVLVTSLKSFGINREYQRAVLFRLGRLGDMKGPGWYWLIPFVDREFHTLAAREHRGCFGKSSCGYGAMIHAMRYAQYWGAIADHSGDALFDFCYYTDWPRTLNELDRYRKRPRAAGRIDVARDERDAAAGIDDSASRSSPVVCPGNAGAPA